MVHYDPYLPEVLQDPYPLYARLRREQPVYYLERFDAWALALFQDIWEASQDAQHYSTCNGTADRALLERKPSEMEVLTSLDPPLHTAVRRRLFAHFSPAAARALEPQMRRWAVECIERHQGGGRIDAVAQLAQPLAVRVACTLSGFPLQDADYLVDLVSRFFTREAGTEGMGETGRVAQREAWQYLERIARERQASGEARHDALGVLLSLPPDERGPFTVQRIAQHLTLLLVGATETFPKTFASGLLRLWQHPDQRRELARAPSLIPAALVEILRYDMPTQWLGRTVIRDHEIRGHKLRAGQPVLFLYPSGNRDEREFERPDVFDIRRRPPRILTFGHGIHRCLGAFMAQMEGKVLLEETLRRFPDYEVLTEELVRPATEFVQGYSRFPIAFRPVQALG
jgi:cytochrome P450